MRFSLLGLWFVALPLMAADPISFRNDREGESFYKSNSSDRAIKRALKDINANDIGRAYDETLDSLVANKLCAYDLNQSLKNKLLKINPKFKEYEGVIYHLRAENEIDDVVAKMLLEAHTTVTTELPGVDPKKKLYAPTKAIMDKALPLIIDFEERFAKGNCFDEAYRNLIGEIGQIDKSIKQGSFEGIFLKAYETKKIPAKLYLTLEQARLNKLENGRLSLKNYYQKISSLRLQYPLRDSNEQSNFVTEKADKQKMSYRQRLLENYSDIQIMLMGNIIKKLRARLESPKVEILIFDRNQNPQETITLEPMERFRLAVKLLRKEMSYLSLNTYFAGNSPSYMDLMVASYELGIIPASELEELGGLEEIWNPTKSFWEKAKVWAQTLSTVATLVIPPPYGFIPALAIVVIEATTEKSKSANENDPTSLF